MKEVDFKGRSLEAIREFSDRAKNEAGFQLDRVQRGLDPTNWKPLAIVGNGAKEIRISEEGQYRVIYVANIGNKIIVLHAFSKKTQKTLQSDIDIAKRAYKEAVSRSKQDG